MVMTFYIGKIAIDLKGGKADMTEKRYTKLNNYYIQDNKTGQKLDQTRVIQRLNKYETVLRKENQMEDTL